MSKKIEELFANFPTEVSLRYAAYEKGDPKEGEHEWDAEPKRVVVSFSFCEKGFGFGEICFKQTPAGLFLDTEMMGKDRVKRYLGMLVDKAITDYETDREKHQLFNQEWERWCGPACETCFPELQCASPDKRKKGRCGECDGCRAMDKVCAEMEAEPSPE